MNRRRLLCVAPVFVLFFVLFWVRPASIEAFELFRSDDAKEEEATIASEPGVPVQTLPDFVTLAERLSVSVVNISSKGQAATRRAPRSPFGGRGPQDFWEPFERFFGPQPRRPQRPQRSLGSGFIIDERGSILTNYHVIENADEITVKLWDGSEHRAKVLGSDKKTDIALLRLEDKALHKPISLGDSDRLKVGSWVMAIGNPFGLDNSVTVGIVSAKSRNIGAGPYDSFIQTDASINPGNSGGPLINLKGQVIGINSAIFSRSGGNIGIGFAIPINLAKEMIPDLETKGRVTRGWLGVLIQKVTPEIADSLGLEASKGALVADVMKEGPAGAAGIKTGDVIVEFDSQSVDESSELPLIVARTPVGKTVWVKVIRGNKTRTIQVEIAELKDDDAETIEAAESDETGLTVQNLTPEIADSLGLEEGTKGVVVTGVELGSVAEDAHMQRGDVILEVNREAVTSVKSFRAAVGNSEKGKSMLLLVKRGDSTIFLALKPRKD